MIFGWEIVEHIPLIDHKLDNEGLSIKKQNEQITDFIDLVRTDNDGIFHYPDVAKPIVSNETAISRISEQTDLASVAEIVGNNANYQFFEEDNFKPPHSHLHINKIKNSTSSQVWKKPIK